MAVSDAEIGGVLVKKSLHFFSSDDFPIHSKQLHHHQSLTLCQVSSNGCCSKRKCLLHSLLVWVFATSLISLTLSVLALHRSGKMSYNNLEHEVRGGDMAKEEENVLIQLEQMLEITGVMKFSHHTPLSEEDDESEILKTSYDANRRRSVESSQDIDEDECFSSNETGAKPLAHIVAPSSHPRTILPNDGASFSILTKQWECRKEKRGIVQGGMKFHQNSGFLELPKAGVYYVYSQVTFRPASRNSVPRRVTSRLVSCVPEEECHYSLTAPSPPDVLLQTESDVSGRYGQSKFQAGMFYFPAGTQLGVLVLNELFSKPELPSLRYDDYRYNTFMGIFLVDED